MEIRGRISCGKERENSGFIGGFDEYWNEVDIEGYKEEREKVDFKGWRYLGVRDLDGFKKKYLDNNWFVKKLDEVYVEKVIKFYRNKSKHLSQKIEGVKFSVFESMWN